MTYEDQLRDAFRTRAEQLDARRPPRDTTASPEDIGLGSTARPRRFSPALGAAMAVAAGAVLLMVLAVSNRSVHRVETGPDLATEPTETTADADPTASVPTTPEAGAAQPSIVSARRLGPATVVDLDGNVLFVLGEEPPGVIGSEVVALIETELVAMPALGDSTAERREALADAGLIVHIALDLDAQARAQAAMESLSSELDAVAVTVDPNTGIIVSAVSRSGVSLNEAQPAASARIVTYAAAFELGFNSKSVIDGTGPCEVQTVDGSRIIENFARSTGSAASLDQQVLRASRCAEVRLETLAGPAMISELMQSMMGTELDGLIVDAPSLTAFEHLGAVAAIANGGKRPEIRFVSRVNTDQGDIVFQRPDATPVVSAQTADAVDALMASNVERGTGTRARLDGAAARGFTGTDTDFRAAWFVGTVNEHSTVVWLARPGRQPMRNIDGRNVTGGSFPAELWASIHAGFDPVQGPDVTVEAPLPQPPPPSSGLCPPGFPAGVDSDDDGVIDTCYRDPTELPFDGPLPATPVTEVSCPDSHPVPDDINGDGINDTCVAEAPSAD